MYLPVLMNVFWPADWLFKQTVLKKKLKIYDLITINN